MPAPFDNADFAWCPPHDPPVPLPHGLPTVNPGDDDDEDEDVGPGNGGDGSIDPDPEEGYGDDDEDDDEDPLWARCRAAAHHRRVNEGFVREPGRVRVALRKRHTSRPH